MSFWKRRGVHIITEQEQECFDFYAGLPRFGGFSTPEDVSRNIRMGTGRTYSPARVLEIAKYCARVNGNVDIWYNAGVEEKTLIRSIDPYQLAREIDEAMSDLRKALQDVYAKKVP